MTDNDEITVSVEVNNTGDFDGEEVVQLYVRDLVATVTPPLRLLKGFEKVFIKKGETKKVEFKLGTNDLAFYHPDLSFYAEPGEFSVLLVAILMLLYLQISILSKLNDS